VDVVLFVETPFYPELLTLAKSQGKRIVCIPMLEWMPPSKTSWTTLVDLYVCPTNHCHTTLTNEGLPTSLFLWPTAPTNFQYTQRNTVNNFLFVNGTGGWRNRKGTDTLAKALQYDPNLPILVRTQRTTGLPPNVKVLPREPDNSKLYSVGDVLLYPAHVDGYGLQPVESMCSGMPVIVPEGNPWNDNPALLRMPTTHSKVKVKRPVDWYNIDPKQLALTLRDLIGADISNDSLYARQWAVSMAWTNIERKHLFINLVTGITPTADSTNCDWTLQTK